MKISGADLLIKALKEEYVYTLFAYPGGKRLTYLMLSMV